MREDYASMSNNEQPFYLYTSKGLWWVREGDVNPALHGPFMDPRDAYEQCGEPATWINHGPH